MPDPQHPAPLHGWLILDKPIGMGSTQAVAAVKRALRQTGAAKIKVGHGGTLDPLANGVLPIALGEATKLAGRMLDASKIYDFTIHFGEQTDTLDREGVVIATSDHFPTLAEVEAVLPGFTGPIEQAPPSYSAIKIDGKRAYDLARAGEAIEMKLRAVTVYSLSILPGMGVEGTHLSLFEARVAGGGGGEPMDGALAGSPLHQLSVGSPPRTGEELGSVTLTAHVSKGTYIRSLAHDIALALGTVGHVSYLRRTKAGPFTAEQAIPLDKLSVAARERAIGELMLPLTAGLDDIPALPVSPDEALALRQGKVLIGKPHTGLLLAMEGDVPVALVEASGPDIRVVRGFNL